MRDKLVLARLYKKSLVPVPRFYGLLLLLAGSVGAQAQVMFPPVQYDRPYTGRLVMETVASQEELFAQCRVNRANTSAAVRRVTAACAFPGPGVCRIVIVADGVLRVLGYTRADTLRHEYGHCNGWARMHAGGRLARSGGSGGSQGKGSAGGTRRNE